MNEQERKDTAAAFAQLALGDPNMECKVTEVTEFGITGTVVPRSGPLTTFNITAKRAPVDDQPQRTPDSDHDYPEKD
jgi:hypothetical protein